MAVFFHRTNRAWKVIHYAQKQIDNWSDEHSTWRKHVHNADANAAGDRELKEGREAKAKANKDGGGSPSKSEAIASKLPENAARRPKAINAQLISRIDFPMESLEVRKSFDRQAMFVFFALAVPPGQKLGKPLTGTLCLETVCKSTVYAQRAINGRYVHLALSR